jgi:hypothetical protein
MHDVKQGQRDQKDCWLTVVSQRPHRRRSPFEVRPGHSIATTWVTRASFEGLVWSGLVDGFVYVKQEMKGLTREGSNGRGKESRRICYNNFNFVNNCI